MNEEEIIQTIKKEIKNISRDRVYYTLKSFRFKPLHNKTIDKVMICIALNKLGLPITPYIVQALTEKSIHSTYSALHNLGDREVLILKRTDSKYLEYIMNPIFLEKIKEQ